MTSDETSELLATAEHHLAHAVEDLLTANSDFSHSLQQAADSLTRFRVEKYSAKHRAHLEPRLRRVAAHAASAKTLLDSAAGFHLGRLRTSSAFGAGYLPNGALEQTPGTGFLLGQG